MLVRPGPASIWPIWSPERVVVHQVGPRRRRTLEPHAGQIDPPAFHADGVQGSAHRIVELGFHPVAGVDCLVREAGQRILLAESDQVDALPQIGAPGEVLGPGLVEVVEGHRDLGPPHGLLAAGRDQLAVAAGDAAPDVGRDAAVQQRLPAFHQPLALRFHDLGVARQSLADLVVLPLDDPLRAGRSLAPHESDARPARRCAPASPAPG